MEWAIFAAIVGVLFVSDLLSKESRGAGLRTALYVAVACAFGGFVWYERGASDGLKFFTGYVLEASLSLDNVFVMSLIFGALAIPQAMRHRVLLIGILTALVLRAIFIGLGTFAVSQFEWLLLVCGAFLIWTGVKSFFSNDEAEIDLEANRAFRLLKRCIPVTHKLDGQRFFSGGAATPLFVALVLVEIADLIFAADSVPATLAVTADPFLVYTSNIFAILGLRSLYGVLEALVSKFEYVGKAVAIVLTFVGAKVLLSHLNLFHVPNLISLGIVLALLVGGVALSLIVRKPHVGA